MKRLAFAAIVAATTLAVPAVASAAHVDPKSICQAKAGVVVSAHGVSCRTARTIEGYWYHHEIAPGT
jgi:uncharacterized membrane protein